MLQEELMAELAGRHGFADESYVEKFIMCFEAHRRISREVECVVRGGLCMPFHQPGYEVRRMSIDVDIMSPCTVPEMDRAMDGVAGGGLACSKRFPGKPYPIDNLASYDITFPSCLGADPGTIKVDAFCGADLGLATRRIPAGSRILDFDTLQEMTVLSRGSLLADKCTTMARGTIGLKPTRQTEIAKQIYDMAVLLRSASREDLETAYDAYAKMTGFKVASFRRDPPYTVPEIASDMASSIHALLRFDTAVTVTGEQNKRYNDFGGSYLSRQRPYGKTAHVADVLLAYLFALSLRRYSAPAASGHDGGDDVPRRTREVDFVHGVLEEMSALGRSNPGSGRRPADGDRRLREGLIRDIPNSFVNKKILRGAHLEHVLLVKALSAVSPSLLPS